MLFVLYHLDLLKLISGCAGSSLLRWHPLWLWCGGFSCCGAQAPGYSVARGVLLDQGSHVYPLHWQVDSQSLDHQKSPPLSFSWSNLPIYFSLLSQLHPSNVLILCCSFSNVSWILCWLMFTTLHVCKPVTSFNYHIQCVLQVSHVVFSVLLQTIFNFHYFLFNQWVTSKYVLVFPNTKIYTHLVTCLFPVRVSSIILKYNFSMVFK